MFGIFLFASARHGDGDSERHLDESLCVMAMVG